MRIGEPGVVWNELNGQVSIILLPAYTYATYIASWLKVLQELE